MSSHQKDDKWTRVENFHQKCPCLCNRVILFLPKPKGYISLSSQILIFINKCLIVILPIVWYSDLISPCFSVSNKNHHSIHMWNHPVTMEFKVSLVAQWLKIHLPMQRHRLDPQSRKIPYAWRASKPMDHNSWACAQKPRSHNYWAHAPQPLKPLCPEPMLWDSRRHHSEKEACALQLESSSCSPQPDKNPSSNKDPAQPK